MDGWASFSSIAVQCSFIMTRSGGLARPCEGIQAPVCRAGLRRRVGIICFDHDTLFFREESLASDGKGLRPFRRQYPSLYARNQADTYVLFFPPWCEKRGSSMCRVEVVYRRICGLEGCGCGW
jgi:hypothetical protein